MTSAEAARLYRVDRSTTRRAAASGQVPGAQQEPRPGAINPPWVATPEAWERWYRNRRPAGRPRSEREGESSLMGPTSLVEAWNLFSAGCGSEAPIRTIDQLRHMIYRMGLSYWVEGANSQDADASPARWDAAYQAMYDTGWAWDDAVDDESVLDLFTELLTG